MHLPPEYPALFYLLQAYDYLYTTGDDEQTLADTIEHLYRGLLPAPRVHDMGTQELPPGNASPPSS